MRWIGRRFLDMELRRMIKWIVALLMIMFVATQCMILWMMGGAVRESRMEMLQNWAAQLQSHTSAVLGSIMGTSNNVAFGITSTKFARAQSNMEMISAYNQLGLLLDSLSGANPNIEHIFYTDFDMMLVGSIEGNVLALRKEIARTCDQGGWPTSQRNFAMKLDGRDQMICITPSYERNGKKLYAVVSYELDIDTLVPVDGTAIDRRLLPDGAQPSSQELQDRIFAVSQPVASTGWRWLCSIPQSTVIGELAGVVQFTALSDFMMLMLMLLLIAALESGIGRPLSSIVGFVDAAATCADEQRLPVLRNNEIGQIAGHINRLLDSVEHTNSERENALKRVYELEITQKQTELNALYSQINPHFLYNTLDCLRSIGMVHDVPEIVDIVTYMSDIFRYSIKGKDFVKLREELECIEEYTGIMQIRYCNRFQVETHVDDKLLDVHIPRMILQPVVENAFFHGLEKSRRSPMLRISCYQDPVNGMWLEVCDNGWGMDQEVLRALQRVIETDRGAPDSIVEERRSIGLANIAHRIHLLFGPGYGMLIDSSPEQGTTVKLHIPISSHMHS